MIRLLADQHLPLIRQELTSAGVAPKSLVLEITETAAIADLVRARDFIIQLKQLGFQLALDDFGVGFSSFRHLRELPVDYLRQLGVDYAQGYHIGRPQPVTELFWSVGTGAESPTQ